MDQQHLPAQQQPNVLETILGSPGVRKRFDDILGKKAAGFVSSIISAVSQNPSLRKADPMTVISAAAVAASLDLPINPNLGFAHIVPYKDRAQFQMGWRGYVQLAQRSGQYRTINVAVVHEGELKHCDKFTGAMEFDSDGKTSDKIIGYVAYFKLLNGFEKYYYMSLEEVQGHGKRYSRSYESREGRWQQDFDSMALKTVIKLLLNRWGILSIDMQTAIHADQAVVREPGDYEYIDSPEDETPINTSEFDKRVADIDVDRDKLELFLQEIARANNSSIEKVKVEAAPRFEEFWQAFCNWASKGQQKKPGPKGKEKPAPKPEPQPEPDSEKFICPNDGIQVSKAICDKCQSRTGCPAW